MKKLFFAVLVLGFVMAATMNAGWDSTTWKDQNPYILRTCGQEVWLVSKLGPSLTSLGLDGLQGSELGGTAAWRSIDQAKTSIGSAQRAGNDCGVLLSVKDPVTLTLCLAIGTTTGQLGTMLVCSDGREAFCNALLGSQINQTCSKYGDYWTATMDNARNGLETTQNSLATSTNKAEQGMNKLLDVGLCDDSYGGTEKQGCMALFSNYLTLRNRSDTFATYRTNFYQESWDNSPNFQGYDVQLRTALLETIPLADEIAANASSLLTAAEQDYSDGRATALIKLAEAGKAVGELEIQKAELVAESASSEESGGTIAARFATLESKVKDAVDAEKTAEKVYGYRGQSYLVTAIAGLQDSSAKAEEVAIEAKKLTEDTKAVVAATKEDAEKEIYDAQQVLGSQPDPAAKAEFDAATDDYKQGEINALLGDRYVAFAAAAEHARTAKNYETSGQTGRMAILKTELDKIAALITNAEKDGLGVGEIKNEFLNYKAEYAREISEKIDPSWMLPELSALQQSIVDLAKAKYRYLETQRASLLEQIGLSQETNYDLMSEMGKAESGVVADGKINYEQGLGKLAALSADYARIAGEINKNAQAVVAGAIAKTSSITYELGEVELDASANLTATLLVYNRYDYGAKNVVLELATPYELQENEINEGAEYVASATFANKKLRLVLTEVKPYDSLRIVFNKKMIAAPVLSKETKEIGKPDGTSEINTKIKFETAYDGVSILMPKELNEWSVDGKEGSGRKSGGLNSGSHLLQGSGIIENAYSMEKTDYRAIPVGPNSEISYDLVITPNRDLDGAELLISDASSGSDSVTDFKITSYSASVPLSNRKPLVNGMYSFSLGAVKKGENVTLRVSYSVARTAEYVAERIAELEKINGGPEFKQLLASAKDSLANNDLRRAAEYVEMAAAELEKEQQIAANEKAKQARMQILAAKELGELNGVELDAAPSLLKAKLEARKALLEKAVAWDTTTLDNYDANWLEKTIVDEKKTLLSDYTKLKKDYLDATGGLMDSSSLAALETALVKLDASGALEDLLTAEKGFAEVQTVVQRSIQSTGVEYSIVLDQARALLERTNELVADYSKEYADASGGSAAAFLDLDYKTVQKEAKALQNLVDKSASKGELVSKYKQVSTLTDEMQTKLSYLKNESTRKLASLKAIYAQKKNSMSDGDRKLVEQGLIQYQEQVKAGNYAEGVKTGDALTSIMNKGTGGFDTILLLGGGALIILGILAFYLVKGGKGPRLSKEKRMPRRLRSVED